MIRVERTFDLELIHRATTHPAVWAAAMDDSAGSPEDFIIPDPDRTITIAVFDDEEFLGLFFFVQENLVLFDIHTRLIPSAFGHKAIEAAKKAEEWLWANTTAWRLTTCIPVENAKAIQFALKGGMAVYGCNPRSWAKDGALHDCLLLGVSRPLGR